ncbi:MAG: LD-carboxypeptidase [Clostridiales bacterium]|nr:LD-carboxypeptidase [Clostridiales bacterium]
MTIYPNKLKQGDSIGIVAPSMSNEPEKIDRAVKNLKNLGYEVVEGKLIKNEIVKCVSGSIEDRVDEFIQMWKDKNVKYIIGATGGEFLMEILPTVEKIFNDEKLYETPKWIQGYSDMTTLLFYLTTTYDIATIQMTNAGKYAMEPLHESLLVPFVIAENLEDNIQENYPYWEKEKNKEDETYQFNLTEESKCKMLNGEKTEFSGRLIGGCLDVISQYTGSRWDNVENYISKFQEGMIWHLENCELTQAEMYRRLWFMREQGWFKNTKGFIFGRTHMEDAYFDFEYVDAIEKAIGDLNVPIIYDIDIGHTMPQWTIVNGSLGTITFDNGKCKLLQKFK